MAVRQPATVDKGPASLPELEALESCARVAMHLGVGEVRPCVASIFDHGVDEASGVYLHVLALEFVTRHRFPPEKAERLLREWNGTLAKPLPRSEISKVLRQAAKPGSRTYGCRHSRLRAFCIGEGCPFAAGQRRWKNHSVSPEGFTCSGWLGVLKPRETAVWLGCYRLHRLKGRGPGDRVPFTFRELERVCNVDRHHHRQVFETLRDHGLLAGVDFADRRGGHSSFKFPTALPNAQEHTARAGNNYRGK